jgi:hypothetical protein
MPPPTTDRPTRRVAQRVAGVARVLSFYMGAIWVYVALIAIFQGGSLPQPLWHELPRLRRDTAGAICFAASFLLFGLAQFLDP